MRWWQCILRAMKWIKHKQTQHKHKWLSHYCSISTQWSSSSFWSPVAQLQSWWQWLRSWVLILWELDHWKKWIGRSCICRVVLLETNRPPCFPRAFVALTRYYQFPRMLDLVIIDSYVVRSCYFVIGIFRFYLPSFFDPFLLGSYFLFIKR